MWCAVFIAGPAYQPGWAIRRFLIHLPPEEVSSKSRLGFQVEQAFWFYEDFYRPATPKLPKLTLRSFAERLLGQCPRELAEDLLGAEGIDGLIEEFYEYKSHVPTCGAIILNSTLDKVLLVRGYSSRATWGFPKGKIAKEEDPAECAIREVLEETGFDIRPHLHRDRFIQIELRGQPNRLYIIRDIPESTCFEPQTRREIKDIRWMVWRELLAVGSAPNAPCSSNRVFNVLPFLGRLDSILRGASRAAASSARRAGAPQPSAALAGTAMAAAATAATRSMRQPSRAVEQPTDAAARRLVGLVRQTLGPLYSYQFSVEWNWPGQPAGSPL